jgi:hypothetical protein
MTRERTANHAYIAADAIDHACPDPVGGSDAPTARQILEKVLETDGGEPSATATLPAAIRRGHDPQSPGAHPDTLAAAASRERWESLLTTTGLDPAIVAEINRSPAASALCPILDDVACAGHNAADILRYFWRAAVNSK